MSYCTYPASTGVERNTAEVFEGVVDCLPTSDKNGGRAGCLLFRQRLSYYHTEDAKVKFGEREMLGWLSRKFFSSSLACILFRFSFFFAPGRRVICTIFGRRYILEIHHPG